MFSLHDTLRMHYTALCPLHLTAFGRNADAPALDVLKAGLKTLEATADCIADAFDAALEARRSE